MLEPDLTATDRRSNRIETVAHIVPKATQGGDEHNSDQRCDQTIFNGRRTRFAFTKLLQKLFQRTFPSDMRVRDGIY